MIWIVAKLQSIWRIGPIALLVNVKHFGHNKMFRFRRQRKNVKRPAFHTTNRSLAIEQLEDRRVLANYVVDNVFDTSSLPGTLRYAINQANTTTPNQLDTITFNLSSSELAQGISSINGPYEIKDDIRIFGPSGGLRIQGDSFATTGLDFDIFQGFGNQSQVTNLVFSGFDDAIKISGMQASDSVAIFDNTFEFNGNAINIEPNGSVQVLIQDNLIQYSTQHGIYVHGSAGGSSAITIDDNTIIASGTAGIKYQGFNAPINITNNRIGITATNQISSNDIGVWIASSTSSSASQIAGNIISGNADAGIFLHASQYPNLNISSNGIGTNVNGDYQIGLGNQDGIEIQFGATFNQITGNTVAGNLDTGIYVYQSDDPFITLNTIAKNGGDGIRLSDDVDSAVIVQNIIGHATNSQLGNGGSGVYIENNTFNTVVTNNTIGFNGGDGITIVGGNALRHELSPNSFVRNVGNPIDLSNDGATANDPNDGDNGPNALLNYPVINHSAINLIGSQWDIPIRLDVDAPGRYAVDLYKYTAGTGSGTYTYLDSVTAQINSITDGFDWLAHVSVPTSVLAQGDRVAALTFGLLSSGGAVQTNSSNTSEMSPPSLPLAPDVIGPRVVDVKLKGSAWTRAPYSFKSIIETTGDQLRPIATQNVNTIQIEFSEHVRKRAANGALSNIDASVLTLRRTTFDANGALVNDIVPSTGGFTYDPITHIATWTFPNLADGKYAIHLNAAYTNLAGIADAAGNFLNAEWNNNPGGTPDTFDDPARPFTTGNATIGTEKNKFRFHFALLAGDFDGDGIVEAATGSDQDILTGTLGDFNGDGAINSTDSSLAAARHGKFLPLRTVGSGDIDDNDSVDGGDLAKWQSGYGGGTQGDVDGDGDSDGRDFLLWQRAFGSYSAWGDPPAASYAEAYAAALGVSLEDLTFGLTPQVINVIINSSISTHPAFSFDTVDGSGAQLGSVPVAFADTISIVFSEDVNVSATSLIVVGMTTANVPELADFTYDPLTHTATWRYEGWAVADNYLLYLQDSITDIEGNFLDGEWINPAARTTNNALVSEFPSGDGVSGGNFVFAMTLLPGDANGDGIADMTDYGIWTSNAYWGNGTKLFTQGDFNGDGNVDTGDVTILYAHMNQNLQNPFLLADLDEDGDVDDVDLDILSGNYGLANPDWADGDLNGDDVIDDDDLDLAFAQFGLSFTNFVA